MRCPEKITGPYEDDPAPTSLVPGAGYHKRYNRSRCWCRKWEVAAPQLSWIGGWKLELQHALKTFGG
ncbi:unnamed protein product [Ilex paraguariensis]|uniref:Uncharacterized protein n=1 Tax=Ilex paraguariensis TaxID=185542 RepID=A0ABC8UT92_9AQUA